ncbi:MAG TPA: peptide-methionine (R)-S-oxide reductase MsrB, partial [Chlamydiales bacterium]|nr:peptide-methionine (R)-S-oxide reductase MsrB [Chlamydiales bacterium]
LMVKQTNDLMLCIIFVVSLACLFLFQLISPIFSPNSTEKVPIQNKPQSVQKLITSDAEWRKHLSAEQYVVMRQHGTEPAFSGLYHDFTGKGTYVCAACNLPLFSSNDKYDSKTGWPTFTKPINPENVWYQDDGLLFKNKTEVLCSRCDSHLGELLESGPAPLKKQYRINSIALKFIEEKPAEKAK